MILHRVGRQVLVAKPSGAVRRDEFVGDGDGRRGQGGKSACHRAYAVGFDQICRGGP